MPSKPTIDTSDTRRRVAVKVVAGLLALNGLATLLGLGSLPWFVGVAGIALALALVRWPRPVRWVVVVFAAAGPLGFFLFALWYYLTLPLYPFLAWSLLGVLAYGLLLFGEITRARLVGGLVVIIAAVALFPLASPLSRPAHSAAVCETRVEDLAAKFKAYLHAGATVTTHSAELPTASTDLPILNQFPVLEIAPHGSWFAGNRLPDGPAAQAQAVATWYDEHGSRLKPKPGLHLALDRSRRVKDLAPLLENLPHVSMLLVAQTEPLGEPPLGAREFAEQFERSQGPGARAKLAADQLSRRAGSCPPFAERLTAVKDSAPEERGAIVAASLENGLPECGCSWVDLDALEYVLLRIVGANVPIQVAFTLPTNDAGEIELPAPELRVDEWARQLAQAAGASGRRKRAR
jgi:hypothetical protein